MDIRGKRILITGGAGFIGSSFAAQVADDNEVIIFDNGHRNAIKDSAILNHPNVRVVWGDVMDVEALAAAAEGCNIVLHLAAIAGVDTVIQMPVKTMEVNLIGTYNALRVARDLPDLERFIDFSTSEVFGSFAYNVQEGDITQLGPVGEGRWTYAVSKLATEHLAHTYHKQYGLPFVSVRPFNIYGPGQVGSGAVHHFVVRAIKDETLIIHNDGSQIRAWCYIDDILAALKLCIIKDEAVGHVFNIGNPRSSVTIYNLANQIIMLSGSKSKIEFVELGYGDVELRIPSIKKATELLGYSPQFNLEEGLLETIKWYRSKQNKS